MFAYPDSTRDLVVLGATFLLIVSLWACGVWLWSLFRSSRRQKVEERLQAVEQVSGPARVLRLWYEGREVTTAVPDQSRGLSLASRWERLRQDAGWDLPLGSATLGTVGLTALVFLLTVVLTGRLLAGVGAAVAVLLILWTYLKQRVVRREGLFDTQFVDALELAARSLRAGHPLVGAFRLISEEIPPPVGDVFANI